MTQPRQRPAFAVVVPVRDEAENIIPVVGEICEALSGRGPFEILYVDDGSGDETPSRLAEVAARVAELRWVRHAESCGQSAALRSGVIHARAPLIVTLDGDGQNDPRDIPKLLDAFERLSDRDDRAVMIAGLRAKRRDGWLRKLSSVIANRVRRALLHDGAADSACGLKLFPRAAFLELPYFDHMHRFLPALMKREGHEVVTIPVNHRPRARGTSKYGLMDRFWVGVVDLLGVMWLMRRRRLPHVVSEGKET